MTKAAASWSGGKDSCLACYKAISLGYEVTHLLNLVSRESRVVSYHGIRGRVIRRQAEAVGIPLLQYTVPADMSLYEQRFKTAVSALRRRGVEAVVFGDIYLQEHRDWVERVCGELGVTPVLPLWGIKPEDVLIDFTEAGFESVIVCARADIFDEAWLGRLVDRRCVSGLVSLCQKVGADVCGEHGEYHTLALNGPMFRRRLHVSQGAVAQRDGYRFLDLGRCFLRSA